IVASQPMLAAELAEPAPERQSGDAGVGVDPHGGRKAMRLRCRVELSQVQAGLRARNTANGVDLDPLHARYVDHHARVAHRTAGDVVAAAANGDGQVSRSGEIDG